MHLELPGTLPIHWKTRHLVILGLRGTCQGPPGSSWDTTRTPRDPMDSLENKAFGDLGTPEGPARDHQGPPGTLRDLQGPPQGPSRTSQGPSRHLPGTSRGPQGPSRHPPGTPESRIRIRIQNQNPEAESRIRIRIPNQNQNPESESESRIQNQSQNPESES